MFYYQDKGKTSWVPVILMLLIAGNLVLVLAVQTFFYGISDPIDSDSLAKADAAYENCTVIDRAGDARSPVLLVATSSGETRLVVLERHLIFNRFRIVDKYSHALDPQEKMVSEDAATAYAYIHVAVSEGRNLATDVSLRSLKQVLQKDFLICVGLLAAELGIGCLIDKLKE